MKRLLVAASETPELWAERLSLDLPGHEVLQAPPADGEPVAYLVIGNPRPGQIAALKGLELILSVNAGVDRLLASDELPGRVPIVRMADDGLRLGMVEWVLARTLSWHRQLSAYDHDQRGTVWAPRPEALARERAATVLGAGALGGAVARALAGVGFRTRVWSRTLHDIPGAEAFAGTIVYQQSPVANTGSGSAWTSSYSTIGGNRTFDSFSLSTGTDIGAVSWRGFYRDSATPSNNPVSPSTLDWTISLWSDSGGPSASLFSVTVPAASVSTTFVGFVTFLGNTVPVYDFRYALSSSFHADAATTYWLSPMSRSATFQPFFAWTQGTGGDASSIQFGTDSSGNRSGSNTTKTGDRAFTVETVPEPQSIALIGISLAGFAGACRSRRLVHP